MNKTLIEAIANGNVSGVTSLLDRGYNVDCCDEEGTNPLHMAAANGDENMVRLLLSRGASLKATNHYGWTALMAAAYYGHLRICYILFQNKADVNAQNSLGATALDCAARCGHVKVVEFLIEAGAEINLHDRFCSGEGVEVSPLMTAAQHGHENVVQMLLRNGAEINYYNEKTQWNSLMLSALNGHTTTVEILVEHGADTNFTNILQQTALDLAESHQRKEVTEYLNQRTTVRHKARGEQNPVRPTIIEAARNGDLESVRDLLKHNPSDVSVTDKDGATALVYAAMGNHLEVVKLLYEQGADLDAQDEKNGWTALIQATYYGHGKVAKFLIDHGANVSVHAKGGWTAFDVASITGDTEMLRLLASVTMQLPAKPNNSYLAWPNMKPKDLKMDKEIISIPKDNMNGDLCKNKNWWSKMSSRFRNFNIMRTLRVPSSTKVKVLETSGNISEVSEAESVGTPRSLAKVLDTTFKACGHEIQKPKTLAFGAPVNKLPDDLISPVLPPPSMSKSSFELTRMQRNMQLDGEDATAPQMNEETLYKVPSLCVNGETIRDGRRSKFLEDNMDNISSVSGYATGRIPATERFSYTSSPESSFSTGSYLPSTSSNSGSRTLSPTSSAISDIPGRTLTVTPRRKSFNRGMVSPTFGTQSPFSAPNYEKLTPKGRRNPKVKPEEVSVSVNSRKLSACSAPVDSLPEECEEDIGAILKSLCLEQYSAKFEEQEIDMEAFLELNGRDLKLLGVIDRDARNHVLAVIEKLNTGKYRERQRIQDQMATYQNSKSTLTSDYASSPSSSASTSLTRWASSPLRNHPS